MFGLTQEQLMGIGGLLGGAGQGLSQGGWQGAFGGAQQGLLNAQQMMQAQEMMKLRKAAAAMQTQQFEMQKAEQARKMQREQALRTVLMGGATSTGGAGGDQVAMQPGLLDQMNVSPIVRAMAQADPEAVGGGLLSQAMKGPEKPIAVPKGTALYDPTKRETIFENRDNDPQSPIAKLQDDLRAGRITPEQYQLGVSKMGPAQTTVNVGNKELDKEAVKFYGEVQRSSMDASASLPKIARARQLAANFAQGATAPTVQAIKRYAKDLGLSGVAGLKDDVGAAEAFNALMIDLRLDMSQRLKGAITEREQVLLEQMVARQGNTVEGNLMILDQLEGIARRSVGQAKALRDYRAKTGSVDAGVFDVMGETPAYEPPPMREPPAPPPAPSGPRPTATGADGKKYVLSPDGKSWVEVK